MSIRSSGAGRGRAVLFVCALSLLGGPACSKDDDGSSSSGSSGSSGASSTSGGASGPTPAVACTDLCTKTGFSASRVEALQNETNCFCSGPGVVTPIACTVMCGDLKKSKPSVFKSSTAPDAKVDACQCQ